MIVELLNKYNTFIKYIISAGISFLLDMTLFTILSKLLFNFLNDYSIIFATVIARIISSLVNYFLNRNKVFDNNKNNAMDKSTLLKYYLLVIIQMFVSAVSVWLIHNIIEIDATFIKVPVDILIFVINYFVQKKFVFKK